MYKLFISAKDTNSPSDGIINRLKPYSIEHYLSTSYSSITYGLKTNILNWGNRWQVGGKPTIITYTFKDSGIQLENIVIRTAKSLCYSTQWYLYGISNDFVSMISSGSLSAYCSYQQFCSTTRDIIFESIDRKTIFSSLFFIAHTGSCTNDVHFSAEGLEFFGTLYTKTPFQEERYKLTLILSPLLYVFFVK